MLASSIHICVSQNKNSPIFNNNGINKSNTSLFDNTFFIKVGYTNIDSSALNNLLLIRVVCNVFEYSQAISLKPHRFIISGFENAIESIEYELFSVTTISLN
ncbi:hypothetical protein VCSRO85_3430 [Vibrio cholerae]|nr:hypothetical protein [Vibrio cholerae]GIA35670.1 hypothetical protein VCSRO85_3430 [Vibrio cholerae]